MTDETDQSAEKIFHFPPEYADCIAKVAANWSSLEYLINTCIWELAEVQPAPGACMTAQIGTMPARLAALLALMKLRHVEEKLIAKVNKSAERVRGPNELRNRLIHDQWANDLHRPGGMGRIEIVAPKSLSMKIIPVPIEELRADVEKISNCRFAFGELRVEIRAALPALPKMSRKELVPIVEAPRGRQSLTSKKK